MKDYNDKSGLAYHWLEANIGRVLLVVLFAGLGLWGLLLEGRADLGLGRRLVRGMGPELAGIVIAAVTIDALAERRQRQSRKAQLIRQLGSKYRDVTEMALLELKHEGWLYDGSLRGVILVGADLSGANLIDAHLSEINFWETNLSEAFLIGANLAGACLVNSNLTNAIMRGANLSEANLESANLAHVELDDANLTRARLWRPNLGWTYMERVNLSYARLEEADLIRASLRFANLEEANLSRSDLSHADLPMANLKGTILRDAKLAEAYLRDAKNWTVGQFRQARTVEGAIMPDGVQLRQEAAELRESITGPTFEEWVTQRLLTIVGLALSYQVVSF